MKKFKSLLALLLALFLLTGCGIQDIISNMFGQEATEPASVIPVPTSAAEETVQVEETPYEPTIYYVTADTVLLVRSGPGTEYPQVRSLPHGYMVTVLYFNGNWGYVGDGWVSKDYLSEVALTTPQYSPSSVVSSHPNYQIVRADRSYYTPNGQVVISHYYDYAVLSGSSTAITKINAQIKHIVDQFLWSDETMNNHARDKQYNPNHPWYYTKTSRVSFIDNQHVHITVSMSWYMGGTIQNASEDYIFDLTTGDPASLNGSISWGN